MIKYAFSKNGRPEQVCGEGILESCFYYCSSDIKQNLRRFLEGSKREIVFKIGGSKFRVRRIIVE